MRLKYSILVFDDQPKKIEAYIARLAEDLQTEDGFELQVEYLTEFSESIIDTLAEKLNAYNPYNLIMLDHDLGKAKDTLERIEGVNLAKKLRGRIYTDMVYYSSDTSVKLRDKLFENKIDGVYVASRLNFVDDVYPIIQDQIKKICDVNNMRGIILDEMSDIEYLLREMLVSKIKIMDSSTKEEFKNKLLSKHTEKHNDRMGTINNPQLECISELVKKPEIFDFDLLRRRLYDISNNQFFHQQEGLCIMQQKRNKFAHCIFEFDNSEYVVKLKNTNQSFDFDAFRAIRKQLGELKTKLKALHTEY